MTQPADLDLDARLRLDAAIAQLTQPGQHPLMRADAVLDPHAAALLADDRAVERELQARHAAHVQARRYTAALRVLDQLDDHRDRVDHRRRRIAAIPDTALTPPLLDQLAAETAATTGLGTGGSAGPYRSIIAIPATELLAHIRATIGHRDGPLTAAVRAWAELGGDVTTAADLAQGWVDNIRQLLNPRRRWHHPGACPDCGARVAHVPDDTGQLVRTPALEFDVAAGRARCLRCPARWTTEAQLRALARLLEQQQETTP